MTDVKAADVRPDPLTWRALPRDAQAFVVAIVVAGTVVFGLFFPLEYPRPILFAFLLALSCITSAWKVTLPIPLASGSTLSVSYAADLMALLLLGPAAAVVVAVAGAWTQCTFRVKHRYPLYRTAFSAAAEAITMAATGLAFDQLGGPSVPLGSAALAGPLVGAIAVYFLLNTGLVAGAIALSAGRSWWRVWRDDFAWSGASFMVAGGAGALAAIVIQREQHWTACLMLAPVYLTYRTYQIFVGRIEDQQTYVAEMQRLHRETLVALAQAQQAERALAEEKEREQTARAAAEEANRLKDQFLATVSHELRTPLNAILGWADMLRTGVLDETRRGRAAEAVFQSARRQAQLIEELLDVARIISGKMRLERTVVNLEDIVAAAVEVLQPAADAKQITIAVDTEPWMGAVYGDAARLQQIAWNLLSNAVKFTPGSGVVHVRIRAVRNVAELIVSDSGEGIPAELLSSVFEPFRQADGSTTRRHGGLGLGLSIVRHLAEAHGGTVSAESGGEGRGAIFTVRLPIVAIAAHPRESPAETMGRHAVSQTASLEGLSVLVVDDDDACREVIAAHLEARQAVVLAAASVSEAMDLLRRERVDVLLADIGMPGEDGYSLIRRVRALPAAASVPAAALTAFARHEDRLQALQAGYQLHLAKPIDAGSLIAAVAALGRLNVT